MAADLHTLFAADRPGFAERFGKAEAAPEPAEETVGDGDYRAFGFLPAGIVDRLELRWWVPGTSVPQGTDIRYRLISRIDFIGEESLRLVMLDKSMICIEGRNLGQLRQKLRREAVTFVQCQEPGKRAILADQCCVITIEIL